MSVAEEILVSIQKNLYESHEINEAWNNTISSYFQSELGMFDRYIISGNIIRYAYSEKLKNCSFFARWYWRKKLYKTLLTLRKYQQGKEYIESIINN